MKSKSLFPVDPAAPDETLILRLIVNQMAVIAIHGEREIDARSLLGFQQAGIFEGVDRPAAPYAKLAKIAADQKHWLRAPSPPGPCILIRSDKAAGNYTVFQVADLFMQGMLSQRKEALSYFDGLANVELLTERTKRAISDCRSDLLSSEDKRWRKAATKIYDATEEDWLLNLAGLRQALEWRFDSGIHGYLTGVLRPSLAGVDSLNLLWWHPHEQRNEIEQAIISIAQGSRTLTEALEGYFRSFGHVPLAPDLSMGRLVAEWRSYRQVTASWPELWSWAEGKGSPVAHYHICQAATTDPTLIPEDSPADFWAEVSNLLSVEANVETNDESKGFGAWSLRICLARHFCQYFECLIPWNDGERPHVLAWWLTERVASLFDRTGVHLDLLHEVFFARTHLHWHLARARAGVSEIRLQTLFHPFVWQRSLVGQLGCGASLGLGISSLEVNTREIVENCMARHLCQGFAIESPEDAAAKAAYGFEMPLKECIKGWLAASPDDERRQQFKTFLDELQDMMSDSLEERLSKLCEPDTVPGKLTLLELRAAAYMNPSALYPLDGLMRDNPAASLVLTSLDDTGFSLLVDVLMEFAAATETEMRVVIPHALAAACLACGDKERRELLFVIAVHCSVATDTISAIDLIFQHPEGYRLRDLAGAHHAHLSAQLTTSPHWLAARIRPVLTALDI